jgi:molybdopterin-containing oxidoreductase family iron-sulfur binding subunit
MIIPGMDKDTIAIAVGYGRSKNLGKAAGEVGKNVYGFSSSNATTRIIIRLM